MVLNPSVQGSGRDRTETLSLLRKETMESIAEEEQGNYISILFDIILCIFSIRFLWSSITNCKMIVADGDLVLTIEFC